MGIPHVTDLGALGIAPHEFGIGHQASALHLSKKIKTC